MSRRSTNSASYLILHLKKIIKEARAEMSRTIFNKFVQLLGYAHDIDIVGRSVCAITE